jgi:hypothetical protein
VVDLSIDLDFNMGSVKTEVAVPPLKLTLWENLRAIYKLQRQGRRINKLRSA